MSNDSSRSLRLMTDRELLVKAIDAAGNYTSYEDCPPFIRELFHRLRYVRTIVADEGYSSAMPIDADRGLELVQWEEILKDSDDTRDW